MVQFFNITTSEQLLFLNRNFSLIKFQFCFYVLLILIEFVYHKLICARAFWSRTSTNFADMIVYHLLHCFLIW